MVDKEKFMDPRNPQHNEAGHATEYNDRNVYVGVYVFQPKNEADEPVGEKKFIEAKAPAHAEAFLQVGYRLATESEKKEYEERKKKAAETAHADRIGAAEERGEDVSDVKAVEATQAKKVDAKKENK